MLLRSLALASLALTGCATHKPPALDCSYPDHGKLLQVEVTALPRDECPPAESTIWHPPGKALDARIVVWLTSPREEKLYRTGEDGVAQVCVEEHRLETLEVSCANCAPVRRLVTSDELAASRVVVELCPHPHVIYN